MYHPLAHPHLVRVISDYGSVEHEHRHRVERIQLLNRRDRRPAARRYTDAAGSLIANSLRSAWRPAPSFNFDRMPPQAAALPAPIRALSRGG